MAFVDMRMKMIKDRKWYPGHNALLQSQSIAIIYKIIILYMYNILCRAC